MEPEDYPWFEKLDDGCNPFRRSDWHGRLIALDSTHASDFIADDVEDVICAGSSGEDYDGSVAAILKLKDGRFAVYETAYGPTGDGFCEDAYGGNADIRFTTSYYLAVTMGLTDEGRRLCKVEIPEPLTIEEELRFKEQLATLSRKLLGQAETPTISDPSSVNPERNES